MAIIKIKGRVDPLIVSYEIGKKVKQRKFGLDGFSKAAPNDLCDLGDVWSGEYGRVVEIELNDKPQPPRIATEEDKPMTPEERQRARDFFAEMRKKYPFLSGQKATTITFSRSGLNEYKQKFGKDYVVPEGAEIIEDLS